MDLSTRTNEMQQSPSIDASDISNLETLSTTCQPKDKDEVQGDVKVSVSMITYNQAAWIGAAIESVLCQETNFRIELVLGDDCSTDGTTEICRQYYQQHPDRIRLLERERNLGVVGNYLRTFQACTGQYVAFLEGDDYWTNPTKLQKQVDFLDANPEFAICCHNVIAVDKNGHGDKLLLQNVPEVSTVEDLCKGDYIATASCVVRNHLVRELPDWIWNLAGCDWPLDILHAEKGKIRFLPEAMAVYRVHEGGMWSGFSEVKKAEVALESAAIINEGLGYRYALSFLELVQNLHRQVERSEDGSRTVPAKEYLQAMVAYEDLRRAHEELCRQHEVKRIKEQELRAELDGLKKNVKALKASEKEALQKLAKLERSRPLARLRNIFSIVTPGRKGVGQLAPVPNRPKNTPTSRATTNPKLDVAVLDDVFPHPLSAFRHQDFSSILESFPNAEVHTTGGALSCLGEARDVKTVIDACLAEHPEWQGKVHTHNLGAKLNARLAYIVFAHNTSTFLRQIEASKVPFVFTLYPGGGLLLHDSAADADLARIFGSAYFRRVIVTQPVTRDYILSKNLCRAEQIAYIPGVVTPLAHLDQPPKKQRYGAGSTTLNICFVAHKYSDTGKDKGYEMFVEVAHVLAEKSPNIQFNVAGGFTENVLDVSALANRIKFHGPQTGAELSRFYEGMDIILSPNIPFVLRRGAFDGFPTGCCTDAALHGVAMFCTDLLALNETYEEGSEIVILPYDSKAIVDKVLYYLGNSDSLARLAENGREKTRIAYGRDAQIIPRLNLIKEIIEQEVNFSHDTASHSRSQNL